jgi:hypothetical protein
LIVLEMEVEHDTEHDEDVERVCAVPRLELVDEDESGVHVAPKQVLGSGGVHVVSEHELGSEEMSGAHVEPEQELSDVCVVTEQVTSGNDDSDANVVVELAALGNDDNCTPGMTSQSMHVVAELVDTSRVDLLER